MIQFETSPQLLPLVLTQPETLPQRRRGFVCAPVLSAVPSGAATEVDHRPRRRAVIRWCRKRSGAPGPASGAMPAPVPFRPDTRMSVTVHALSGAALGTVLPDLARLRIGVFRAFPYLCDGDEAYG